MFNKYFETILNSIFIRFDVFPHFNYINIYNIQQKMHDKNPIKLLYDFYIDWSNIKATILFTLLNPQQG